jgi:hypothetical protein
MKPEGLGDGVSVLFIYVCLGRLSLGFHKRELPENIIPVMQEDVNTVVDSYEQL